MDDEWTVRSTVPHLRFPNQEFFVRYTIMKNPPVSKSTKYGPCTLPSLDTRIMFKEIRILDKKSLSLLPSTITVVKKKTLSTLLVLRKNTSRSMSPQGG